MSMRRKAVETLYDNIGGQYHDNRAAAVSDYTELPAVVALAGDVRGQRVLDAGCGPGRHARKLLAKGAQVTGIDISAEMVRLAGAHCAPQGRFFQADFTQVEFAPASFDLIIASLTLMYAKDVQPVIKNFSTWLRPKGRLIFSLYHPVRFFQKIADLDFAKSRKVWLHLQGCDVTVFNYYHPLPKYFAALHAHGFVVLRLVEPVLSRRYKGWPEDNYRVPRSMIIEAQKQ
jgi:SAM-dependent methyltransferase